MSSSEYRSAQQPEKLRYSYPQQSAPAPREDIVSVASPDKKPEPADTEPSTIQHFLDAQRAKRRRLSLSLKCALNPNR